ncbi:UDP-N-acetylmuramoyl-tripeptide--D-alanyl-D-alanine ligase [Patescibacteria group bacterium]|nr:UDP-N-acetylmuramoyl-tripeptide--D-alanyl-D-alanine ligase [Patescibacteria group bacterium]MBU0776963.1 UDP-N-acetylmuramoyl-tripeptide--D-alanyl-D-alanine ligase [Patescibacteria group bacterium]MBU0845681.1 UDP-N-acetylmuramoyl-tripeptide--D-alanyl-D-alanine ligase [Patescibacteria group bacterium]MBU0922992.1 UDP-N-acetylmuramoyl-tripeptide--D-alanyl-D-alanine ligase [Patescibacteria group bacterium]MBU1844648.1 UDP-N-acetylmuramoyl-tripeptide--D-alanyl-D-alanine ligase [Patescibacteria 
MGNKIYPIVQWWVAPHLPKEHVFITSGKKSSGLFTTMRLYLGRWIIHPIKRHLAHEYSKLLIKSGCEIIGVAGSVGKTTTKNMIASVLLQKYTTAWTFGNIDPIYNIPATVLSTGSRTKKLVLEMGIEFLGEMDYYLWLVQPKVGVITTIYWTHTEFLGSLDNVVKEKGKLIKSLPKNGCAVLNIDDPQSAKLKDTTKAEIVWYGLDSRAQIRGKNISITKDFKTKFILETGNEMQEIVLPLLGQQFVSLALAAAAVGHINGLNTKQIKKGLEKIKAQPHRMTPSRLKNDTIVIDDTYNANPIAVREAIRLMSSIGKKRRKILVLGEMKELGRYEEEGHREVGKFAVKEGVDCIITLGSATRYVVDEARKAGLGKECTYLAKDKTELLTKMTATIKAKDIILIKGSRSLAMEEIVERLTK